jgi:ribose/xylose/arabinose/galactoside ABC-type transport system permease subunit
MLRGLPAGSHCPECALPTDWSLGVRALRESQRDDRAWTQRLRIGVRVLLAAQAILVVALTCSIANDLHRVIRVPFFLWTLPLVVILGAIGAWMVGAPTLFAQCDRWWGWVRRSMRGVVFVTALAGFSLCLNEYYGL